ncbi:MAG: hypothetical protein KUG82_07065 [Pseudomonadales bacterium]|nr:hypothetical protein [Pseudomonadales bacterium]
MSLGRRHNREVHESIKLAGYNNIDLGSYRFKFQSVYVAVVMDVVMDVTMDVGMDLEVGAEQA